MSGAESRSLKPSVQRWMDRLYPDQAARSPTERFRQLIERYVEPGQSVIDLGAGAGEINAYALKGRVGRIIGVDLNERVRTNPLLDEGIVADLASVPLPDATFDLAISIYVLEHIADPPAVVREIHRLLRPGGHFIALTPSRFHYVSLLAAATPTGFHQWANERRGRDRSDTFPTVYRMNTRRRLRRLFDDVGMLAARIDMFEVPPHYLTFNVPSFLAGAAYERFVNSSDLLAGARVNIACVFTKPRLVSGGSVQ